MTKPLRIELFGGLRTHDGIRERQWAGSAKPSVLLAYLAYFPERQHSRDQLIELLWPEVDPESGRNRLNVTFSRLRREFPDVVEGSGPLFLSDRFQIGLNPDCVETDAGTFERLMGEDRSGPDEDLITRLGRALLLFRGQLLPGFFEEWVSGEAERLKGLYAAGVESLVALLEKHDRYADSLLVSRRAIQIDRLNEHAYEAAIRALTKLGRQAEALKQYRELEAVLSSELGVSPSPATLELLAQIESRPAETGASCPPPTQVPTLEPTPAPTLPPSHEPETPLEPDAAHTRSAQDTLLHARDQQDPAGSERSRMKHWRHTVVFGALAVLLSVFFLQGYSSRPVVRTPASSTTPAGGRLLWEWHYTPAPDEGASEPRAMASDAAGNLYVCGIVKTKTYDVDFLTLKFAPDRSLVWRRRWNYGPVNDCDRARAICVDSSGNVYVMGDSYGGDREKGLSQWDVVTVKYDKDGKECWSVRFDGGRHQDDSPIGFAIDRVGNSYLAVNSTVSPTATDCCLVKYDTDGKRQWQIRYVPSNREWRVPAFAAYGFAVAENGDVCLTGEANIITPQGAGSYALTTRYDRHGNLLWDRRFSADTSRANVGVSVVTDRENNVYVAATAMMGIEPDGHATRHDMHVLKYDAHGQDLWASLCHVGQRFLSIAGCKLAVDKQGRAFALCTTGTSGHRNVVPFTYGLSREGQVTWRGPAWTVTGSSNLVIDSHANCTLSGEWWPETKEPRNRFAGSPLIRTTHYAMDGSELWHADYTSSPDQSHTAVYQEPAGTVFTGGQVAYRTPQRDMLLLAYSP